MSPDELFKFEKNVFKNRYALGLTVDQCNRGLTNKFTTTTKDA